MSARLYSIKYADKHAAAMVYKKIAEIGSELGIIAHGLERYRTKSRRSYNHLKITLALKGDAQDLPSKLKILQRSLESHNLYPYLSFDFCVVPISRTEWNFDSYDDPNYQKIFIRKRT